MILAINYFNRNRDTEARLHEDIRDSSSKESEIQLLQYANELINKSE